MKLFKNQFCLKLTMTLYIQLSMNKMFTRDSDLSGLTAEREPLYVSHINHKAFIGVNGGSSESDHR